MILTTVKNSYQQHKTWLDAVQTIETIQDLCNDIRTHRGTTTAQLAGDKCFNAIAFRHHQNIDEYFLILDKKASTSSCFLSTQEVLELQNLWHSLEKTWSDNTPQQCFDSHSKLLERLNRLCWLILIRTDNDILSNTADNKSRICRYIFNYHLTFIEIASTLRGLACRYCCQQRIEDAEKDNLERHIQQLLSLRNNRYHLDDLPLDCATALAAVTDEKQIDRPLMDFINTIQTLQQSAPQTLTSADIFLSAAEFLSLMKQQLTVLIAHLRTTMPSELNSWVYRLSHPIQQSEPMPRPQNNSLQQPRFSL